MSWVVRKFILILILLSAWTGVVLASDPHADEAKPTKQIKTGEDSFSVVQARVASLEAKIKSAKTEIEKLILEKQGTKDPAKVNELVEHMVSLHNQMKQNNKDYEQQRSLLKYRYPEKGLSGEREYERIDVQSLGEMETEMSLGGAVKSTLKKVRLQYGQADEPQEKLEKRKQQEVQGMAAEQKQSLIEPVILKK